MTEVRRRRRLPVLDPVRAKALADEGLARAEAAHNAKWATIFDDAIEAVASRQFLVCSDDVWEHIGKTTGHHGASSALGGAFRRAQRDEILVPLDHAVLSKRPAQHGNWLRVWKSLIAPSDTHVCIPCAVCADD